MPSLGLAFTLAALTSTLVLLDISVADELPPTPSAMTSTAVTTPGADVPAVIEDSEEDEALAIMPNLASRLAESESADADEAGNADEPARTTNNRSLTNPPQATPGKTAPATQPAAPRAQDLVLI